MSGSAQPSESRHAWEGYSILGNGNLTAVYSDDPQVSAKTHAQGIQHFYFSDYTADYVAGTKFELPGVNSDADQIGMKNFFTTHTNMRVTEGATAAVLCFVHPQDAVVLSLVVNGGAAQKYRFQAQLRKSIKTDEEISLTSLDVQGSIAVAMWSNGAALGIFPKSPHVKTVVNESTVSISGEAAPGVPEQVLLIPGSSTTEVHGKIWALRQQSDLESAAAKFWESWMNSGKVPSFQTKDETTAAYVEAFKRNLYCVKAVDLQGQIPADVTGQFVTNNMPQLYPRDAMMCARVLLATGHAPEARQVIEFWANRSLPMKSPGEWYARYDAHAKAVDSGTGARYDEPEWDANGYFIYLVNQYHEMTGEWIADRSLIYQLADFLVSHLDPNGLLYEGGIVEWTGYLPATNMIDSAALKVAARIAEQFGDKAKAQSYQQAAERIAQALPQMFDTTRQTYADVRFAANKGANSQSIGDKSGHKIYVWDTTANVGATWGYPDHRQLALSNVFYAKNTVGLGGGMRYFDSPEPGLAEYGHGFFFFTTAAAAEYHLMHGDRDAGRKYIDWMLRNANSYGLMPEHISPDGRQCSPASPLSWCCAEFAAAILLLSQKL